MCACPRRWLGRPAPGLGPGRSALPAAVGPSRGSVGLSDTAACRPGRGREDWDSSRSSQLRSLRRARQASALSGSGSTCWAPTVSPAPRRGCARGTLPAPESWRGRAGARGSEHARAPSAPPQVPLRPVPSPSGAAGRGHSSEATLSQASAPGKPHRSLPVPGPASSPRRSSSKYSHSAGSRGHSRKRKTWRGGP